MRTLLFALFVCMLGCATDVAAQYSDSATPPKRETRAVWLTTYGGLDWPKSRATSEEGIKAQQEELRRILDRLKEANFNTVLLQTRVRSSVIYPSAIEPWDGCLTGTAGRAPGYDPLAFAVSECHKRGMELHAWIVTVPCHKATETAKRGKTSPVKKLPKLCVRHGDSWYLDPGQPETAEYLASICAEVVTNYDVDGIHLDYMRYPENASKFNDKASYTKYGKKQNKADWRRGNVTHCVRTIYHAVKKAKPWVKVSSSPVGKYDDLSRYSSSGWNARTAVLQDAQGWMREGIQDILFPMMYFRGNHFYPFAIDWKENDCGRPVVAGLGVWFLSPKEKDWPLEDITRELYFTRAIGLGGQAFFRYAYLDDNHKGVFDFLKDVFYPYPALTPVCPGADGAAPESPLNLHKCTENGRNTIRWDAPQQEDTRMRYNIYASRDFPVDVAEAANLVATCVDSCSFAYNVTFCALNGISFAVTAMDAYGRESAPVQLEGLPDTAQADTPGLIPHDSLTLDIPGLSCPFIAFTDMSGRIVATTRYSEKADISRLPKGVYRARTLEKKGRSRLIGYFAK